MHPMQMGMQQEAALHELWLCCNGKRWVRSLECGALDCSLHRLYRLVYLEFASVCRCPCMQMPMMEPPTQFGLQSPGGCCWLLCDLSWKNMGLSENIGQPSNAIAFQQFRIKMLIKGVSSVSRLLEVVGQSPQTATLDLFSWLPKPCRCSGLWK